MKRIIKYAAKYKLLFLIPNLAMIVFIGLDLLNPIISRRIIDDAIIGGEYSILTKLLFLLVAITVGKAVAGYIREFMFDYAGSKAVKDIRKDLFDHIQSMPFEFFDKTNTGEIMSRTTEDVNNIWQVIGFTFGFLMEQALFFVVGIIMMLITEWRLALVCLALIPFIGYYAINLEKKIGEAYDKISDQNAVLNTTAQENIAGVRLVKAFGREKHEISKFFKENEKNYALNIGRAKIVGDYYPKIEFLTNIVMLLVVCVGGYMVIQKHMTIGDLFAFNWYVTMIVWPMRHMGFMTNNIAQCSASAKKIFAIMDIEPGIKSPENPIKLRRAAGELGFQKVSLKYEQSNVLKDINFHVKAGETLAIMGATGSGKSSISNLIGRFYDVSEGSITLDGIDIKRMDLRELRRNISVVMQDTFLFSDTIEENIRFGAVDATEEEIIAAAKAACVHDFVAGLERGYKTVIGERGVGLSGGQKQRIAIARALLKNSRLLVLDDATSALDMETEYQLQRALKGIKGLTKIIIAHRISAVKEANEIILLDRGTVVERGTHQSLLWKKGRYYEIYRQQYKDIDAVEEEVI